MQKDGELKPGAKGISLNAKDHFAKIVENLDQVSAALENEDESFQLELSDKCVPKALPHHAVSCVEVMPGLSSVTPA